MCTAKAQGGQRCFSSVKESLAVARAHLAEAETAYGAATVSEVVERDALCAKGVAAEYAYQDALAQYASTKQGHADLTARLPDAPSAYHSRGETLDPNRADDKATLTQALEEGAWLSTRATETKRAVKAGEMSPETAELRSAFPNEFAKAHRVKAALAAVEKANQVRYSELFITSNALKDSIYAAQRTAEDSADVHAIGELEAQLAFVTAEMEAREVWRPNHPRYTGGDTHAEAQAVMSDEASESAFMEWQGPGPEPTTGMDDEGFYLDEYGTRYGHCNACGEEAEEFTECCDDGEVVGS